MKTLKLLIMGLLAAFLTFPLIGCEDREGPLQEAQEQVEEGAEETGEKIEEAGEEVEDTLDR